ncbi:MAG TPA: hypothetical protein VMY42_09525, partial [Thermoguttaceae bacterium]|nr:hypothetical protein [Thermoguttaceae bacterium]
LRNTRITDDGLRHLSEMRNLRFLDLSRTAVTGGGLGQLQGLSALRSLKLENTHLRDTEPLRTLPALQCLSLAGSDIDDAGVKRLVELPELAELHLGATPITDKALEYLAEANHLRFLDFNRPYSVTPRHSTIISFEAAQRLRQALPECRIEGLPTSKGSERIVPRGRDPFAPFEPGDPFGGLGPPVPRKLEDLFGGDDTGEDDPFGRPAGPPAPRTP